MKQDRRRMFERTLFEIITIIVNIIRIKRIIIIIVIIMTIIIFEDMRRITMKLQFFMNFRL